MTRLAFAEERVQARRGGEGTGSELEEMESPRSPEAEIGHRVEDLWEVAEPQLSPSEKLNSCFEDIPVASFPRTHPSQGDILFINYFCGCLAPSSFLPCLLTVLLANLYPVPRACSIEIIFFLQKIVLMWRNVNLCIHPASHLSSRAV